jgi:hypothetical protein
MIVCVAMFDYGKHNDTNLIATYKFLTIFDRVQELRKKRARA